MVVRWTLFDPITDETYTFPFNPNEGGTPALTKNITYKASAALDGTTLMFEGRAEPQRLEFSGVILEEAHLEALTDWFEKRNKIVLTDDLGREFTVYLTEFSASRVRRGTRPYYHTYRATAVVVE